MDLPNDSKNRSFFGLHRGPPARVDPCRGRWLGRVICRLELGDVNRAEERFHRPLEVVEVEWRPFGRPGFRKPPARHRDRDPPLFPGERIRWREIHAGDLEHRDALGITQIGGHGLEQAGQERRAEAAVIDAHRV